MTLEGASCASRDLGPSTAHTVTPSSSSSSLSPSSQNPTTCLLLQSNTVKLRLCIPDAYFTFVESQRNAFAVAFDSQLDAPCALALALEFLKFLLTQRSVSSKVLSVVLQAFEAEFFREGNEIHSLVTDVIAQPTERQRWLRIYYQCIEASEGERPKKPLSALFRHAKANDFQLMAVFGGQGEPSRTCLEEFQELYASYKPLLRRLMKVIGPCLHNLSTRKEFRSYFETQQLDLETWTIDPATAPGMEFVSQAPVSVPLIGALSFARYCVTCHVLGCHPGEMRSMLHATTGHSQGLLAAIAVAISDSWDCFYRTIQRFTEVLFYVGWECYHAAPCSAVSSTGHLEADGVNALSFMLNVRGLQKREIEAALRYINTTLTEGRQLFLSLINSFDQVVIAGPVSSLLRFKDYLDGSSSKDTDQTRIPFSKRGPCVQYGFIPVSTPFHTPYLAEASKRVQERLNGEAIETYRLQIPVYHTRTGLDLRQQTRDLLSVAIDAIACEQCDWPTALAAYPASHVLTFNRGGLAPLVKRIQEGNGVRVLQASDFDSRDPEMGTVRDLFAPQLLYTSTRLQSWEQLYWPCLPKVGKIQLKSRLSRVIRAPPVMVAGMTPTTMHPDVVAAVMNAGYHAELAAGGYYNPAALEAAIYDLTSTIPYGRGITCNLIYANPQSMSWQIELLRRLSHSGVPIEGLTIGAGVPSVEVASNYIETLGLQHISFKPGSSAAILQVVEIAKRHPTFPIILQWTGGRGGGHHSFEDFHAPILATYAMLRQQSNMYLVAGSGLGDSDSIYPYLTGSWSTSSGQPAMPFDGVLLGSRMMVAQEAHTSLPVRKIIASTSGVPDEYWEQTYNGPAGGVITVMSEMGEPIHKIATRGVCLWAELDKTIFSLPQMERLGYLDRHRFSIIRRLNDDFAKPWFGRSIQGQVVNLEEMTYLDVLARLVELMYVEHKRWIDPSYVDLAMTVAQRWFERLPPPVFGGPENPTMSLLRDSPHSFLSKFASSCPTASEDLLSLEDISFFLIQCKRPGIKPVNFIPALDADFEFYFKKDSLWQAEDVEAVVGQDAGRVCILHGPVAAQYSRIESEPAAAILNTITAGLVRRLQSEPTTMEMITTLDSGFSSPGSWSTTSSKERDCSEESPCTSLTSLSELVDERLSSPARIAVPPSAVWPPWVQALFEDPIILQDNVRQQNPFGWLVQNVPNIYAEYDSENSELGLTEHTTDQRRSILKAVCFDGTDIGIEIYVSEAINPLVLLYRFEQKGTTMVLKEVHKKRNERVRLFYRRLWAGQDQGLGKSVEDTFYGPKATLTRELLNEHTEAIGAAFPDYRQITPDTDILPICYGIIQAWSVITHPLTLREVGGNLLRLVHRSNTFEYCGNAHPLRIGDTVSSKSTIQSVYDEDAGRVVVVKADIIRAKQLVMIVTSTFLLRGPSREVKSVAGFQKAKEQIWSYHVASGLEEALLLSRSWFKPISPSESFTEKTLVFVLTTATSYSDEGVMLHVAGSVFSSTGSRQQELGKVDFRGTCTGNPVLDFLERRGKRTELRTIFENPGWSGKSKMKVQMPPSNRRYAQLSKDFNPIHISPIFARLAGLPGKLCHGMLTAAVVEKVLELLGLEGDRARLRRFEVTFVDMVMPNEKLVVQIKHTGMVDGRMCFNIVASREKTDELVVQAEAEAEQPPTAYLFTGQGSQSKGMGMELYSTSAIAKAIWDEIDQKLHEKYGWSVLDIVRNNPTALTIHFGGREGRKIRKRYLDITTDVLLPNGRRIQKCVLPGLTATSTSYTFTHLKGLLYSTQFAQPAILLFEAAAFADLRAKGYVSDGAVYAGHSLGEYGALSALSRSIPTGALIELAFYRGSVMQASIAGDDPEAATYGMVAMNPKRVGEYFTQATLGCLVRHIAAQSEELLEIVNFNIDGEQYVCSGTTENLYTLGKLIDRIAESPNGSHLATEPKKSAELASLIESLLEQAKTLPRPIQLQRGKATIPLEGIDIPFHSSHLRRTVDRFRECLLRPGFLVDNIDVEQLVGKYIPNLMARPFSLDREYIQEAFELTQSPVLRRILSELSTCTG